MSDFFPQEIVKEILFKLPAQALIKCMSVCKHWHSLITSTSFITTHLSRSLSSPPTLLLRYFTEPPKKQLFSLCFDSNGPRLSHNSFPSPFKTNRNLFFRIVGSLHGLLCLSDDLVGIVDRIILWNPSIRRYVLLPKPNAVFAVVGPHFAVLGFGFDSRNSDYKVVRLSYAQGKSAIDEVPPRVEVYSLKGNAWREINASCVKYFICEREWSQCFMNTCIHWIAYEGKSGQIEAFILMFDVCDEKFKRMKLPESLVHVLPISMQVAEIGGSLAVLHYDFRGEMGIEEGFQYYLGVDGNRSNSNRYCDVWVRKEYGVAKSWTKLYSIGVEGGVELVLSWRARGEFLVATQNGNLVSYDPESQQTNDLGIQGIREAFYAQNYTESLLLLDEKSPAASYGGAKEGCQTHKGSRELASTVSGFQKESASILVSEDGNAEPETRPARVTLDTHKHVVVAYQLTKFKCLRENH